MSDEKRMVPMTREQRDEVEIVARWRAFAGYPVSGARLLTLVAAFDAACAQKNQNANEGVDHA